ncbi:hypothetical protein [Micromonospora viridifaciens]|uniref:hypothetical protein n=1 Tax=Micromonospora viridifaciens TaxID=1881 RepID=UPI0012FD8E29|nr:hypothetical protein [Micromonospora viridifaciens]
MIEVAEAFYRFGSGPLKMFVAEVLSRREEDGHTWAELRGHDARPDGSLSVRERFALVRVDKARVVGEARP